MKPSSTIIAILLLTTAGCGTSKWTDTGRSATEQLLITDAMDRAVSDLEFRALAGKTCYIDSAPLKLISDSEYLVSCLRQHMFASGCMVKDSKTEADYVVEVRAGAVGTDRHDVLYGVPAVNVPSVVPVTGIPSQIPEMPFIKKTDQRAVVKLSLFAYHQKTGRPIWQSGAVPEESNAKAVWVLGAGPFQRGTIFDGMEFAGDKLDMPLVDIYQSEKSQVSVADEAYFADPMENVAPEEKAETAVAAANEKKPEQKPADATNKPAPEKKVKTAVASDEPKQPKPKTADPKNKPAPVVPAGHAEPASNANPADTPPPSPAPPATPADSTTNQTVNPPKQLPTVTTHESPTYSSNDLAPALAAFSLQPEPRLLQTPVSPDGPLVIPERLETSSPSITKLVIPD
jgi:hypothetical protein